MVGIRGSGSGMGLSVRGERRRWRRIHPKLPSSRGSAGFWSIDFEPRHRYVAAVAVQELVLERRPVGESADGSCRGLAGVSGVGARVVAVQGLAVVRSVVCIFD